MPPPVFGAPETDVTLHQLSRAVVRGRLVDVTDYVGRHGRVGRRRLEMLADHGTAGTGLPASQLVIIRDDLASA